MRSDIQKVITEHERYGSSAPNRKAGMKIRPSDVWDDDDQPKRLSRAQLYGGREKGFTDVLNPLRRYLRKNVGRPWNKVYSEIREHLDDRSIMGQHPFEHLSLEVDIHAVLDGGVVYAARRYAGRGPVTGLYVHPRTGLLCWAPRRNYRKERLAREAGVETTSCSDLEHGELHQARRIWFRAEYERAEPPAKQAAEGAPDWLWFREGSSYFRRTSKRQCGTKELRANALVNSPSPT